MKDEHGNLQLLKAAKAFHPGPGVYRSSYMNAHRLAVTENNMAYRTADYERYQRFDFVVGIEVHLSNNHNCKGVPNGQFVDICDELQGKYPKDFKFVGWHPHCRCYVTSILKTPEEMDADEERMDRGEQPTTESENEVKDVPHEFKKWLDDNEERIAKSKSLPYFLRDNKELLEKENKEVFEGIAEIPGYEQSNTVKVGKFVEVTKEQIYTHLKDLSANFTHEEAYTILSDGRIYHKVGGKGEVNFSDAEKEMFAGGELYHNHDNNTFSPNDIAFMYVNRLKSIRAITTSKEFIAFAPNVYDATLDYDYITSTMSKQAFDNLMKKMALMNSKEADNARLDAQHLEIKELCKLLGIKYVRVLH
ncbi:MAG: hypothetical protein IJQ89_04970 [Bacteroidales bacterium]|nr:hypothetical protein [Bacteroidales bacterium]